MIKKMKYTEADLEKIRNYHPNHDPLEPVTDLQDDTLLVYNREDAGTAMAGDGLWIWPHDPINDPNVLQVGQDLDGEFAAKLLRKGVLRLYTDKDMEADNAARVAAGMEPLFEIEEPEESELPEPAAADAAPNTPSVATPNSAPINEVQTVQVPAVAPKVSVAAAAEPLKPNQATPPSNIELPASAVASSGVKPNSTETMGG